MTTVLAQFHLPLSFVTLHSTARIHQPNTKKSATPLSILPARVERVHQRSIAAVDRNLEEIENQVSQAYYVRDQPIWEKDDDPRIADLQRTRCRDKSSVAKFAED